MSRPVVSLALAALSLVASSKPAPAAKAAPATTAPAAAPDADAFFAPLKWRSIGPFRGGRSNASTGVLGDPKTLYPDMPATLAAAETLVKEGFQVMVYCTDDPIAAKRFEETGVGLAARRRNR